VYVRNAVIFWSMISQIRGRLFLPGTVILAAGFLCAVAAAQDSGPPDKLLQLRTSASESARQAAVSGAQVADAKTAGTPLATDKQVDVAQAAPHASANTNKAAGTPQPSGSASSTPKPAANITKPAVDRGVPDDYKIGAGDVLHISVWHEPDATVSGVIVRPDGNISMPLVKQVAVVGLTPTQLEKQLTQELAKFMSAPDVTVVVTGINSKKVYAIGAVKKEGPIPYTYRMTVLQALSEAGGLTEYAKHKKIYILRTENGRATRLRFDYNAVLKGEHMELNVPLLPGDTIVVPQ